MYFSKRDNWAGVKDERVAILLREVIRPFRRR